MKVDLLDLKIATLLARKLCPTIGTQVKKGKIQVALFSDNGKGFAIVEPITDYVYLGEAIKALLKIGKSNITEMLTYRDKVTLSSKALP